MMGKTLISLLLCLFSLNLQAAEQLLLEVSNSIKGEEHYVTYFYLILDNNNHIAQIEQHKLNQNSREIEKIKIYTVGELEKPVVLEERNGQEVIRLKTNSFSPVSGGELEVQYLRNGITGTYQHAKFTLTLREGGRWWLSIPEQKTVNKVILHPNKILLIGTIGIDEIEILPSRMVCSEVTHNPC